MPAVQERPPHQAIRDAVTNGGAEGWQYKDLAARLYQMADVFKHYFLSPRVPEDFAIPQLVLAFDAVNVNTLAWYVLDHNATGLKWEVGLNTKHLNRPFYSVCESLLHEMIHLYQESMCELKVDGFKSCRGGYHNKQFVDLCEQAGLHPLLGFGAHWKPADGQFAKLMDRLCIAPPRPVEVPKDQPKTNYWDVATPKPKGSSSLIKYVAQACPKPVSCSFRGGHAKLTVCCRECQSDFQPQL